MTAPVDPGAGRRDDGGAVVQVEELKGVRCDTLSNGLKVISHKFPRGQETVVSFVVKLRDSRDEKRSGLAHLTEHLLVRFARGKLAPISPMDLQGETTFDAVTLLFQVMHRDLPSVIDALLSIFSSLDEIVAAAALEAEKRGVAAEMEAVEADIGQILTRRVFQEAFRVHPYGVGDPGGQLEAGLHVEQAELKDYCRRVLQPHRCSLIMVGAFDQDDDPAKIVVAAYAQASRRS